MKSTLTESQRNARAQGKLIRECTVPGLVFRAQNARHVVHVAIHNGAGAGSSLTFTEDQFESCVDSFLENVRSPESIPTVARLLRHENWQQRCELDRMSGELQVLRWRIMHLERDAAARVPAYNNATAIALIQEAK